MNWKKIIDERNFEIIDDEDSINEIEISDGDDDDEDVVDNDDNDDYDSFYENNKHLVNFSRSIVEAINKMIDRLKDEEQQEKEKEMLKNVKF
jgi:hypothetical protein